MRLAQIAVKLAQIAVKLAQIAVKLAQIAVKLAQTAVKLAQIAFAVKLATPYRRHDKGRSYDITGVNGHTMSVAFQFI